MTRPLCVAIVLASCAACAGPPQASLPPEQARMAQASGRAAALARSGDFAAAALKFQEALRIARTLEDADAIAANVINLSIVYQRLGHPAAARSALAVVLQDERRRFPERRLVQAQLRQAILDLAAGDASAAAAGSRLAAERCQRIGCELAPAILNVQANAALDDGAAAEALVLAQAAESMARSREDRAETANALRLVGRARVAIGDPANAVAALEQALAIDRALAEPRKILADLVELSRASAARGDAKAAYEYSERARAVSRAAQEASGVEQRQLPQR